MEKSTRKVQEMYMTHVLGEALKAGKRVAREHAAPVSYHVSVVVVPRRLDEEQVKTRRLGGRHHDGPPDCYTEHKR